MTPQNWKKCKIGDLLEIRHGYAFEGKYFTKTGSHIVVTPGNFYEKGGFKDKEDKEKWYSGPIPNNYVLKKDDLIVAMTEQAEGLLGSSALIPNDAIYLHNQRLGLIQIADEKKCYKRFIYYLFNLPPVRQQIRASASGVKVRHTSPSRIAEVKVFVPEYKTQKKIADILSKYDDLIENNQRRARILEEMAQNLYREWFVHFRFPGHESISLIDSPFGQIPKGWRAEMLGDYLADMQSGKRPKGGIDPDEHGVPSVGAENIDGLGNYNYDKEKYVSEDFFTSMNKGIVKDQDVLLYKDGAYIGKSSFFRDNFPHARCAVNEHVFILRSSPPLTQNWLYFLVAQKEMRDQIISTNANAAQPGINQQSVRNLKFLLPKENIIRDFSDRVEPMLALLFNLAKRNRTLSLSRDLLLPKLISGDVDLSKSVPQPGEAA